MTVRSAVTNIVNGVHMRIAIIGAGYAGMSAAYDLKKAGHDVVIYESADYVGGLASGFKEPHWDWSVEKFYHHWFQSDASMMGIINELGLMDKVIFPRPLTVMLYKDKFYPFDSILNALLFPGLGFGLGTTLDVEGNCEMKSIQILLLLVGVVGSSLLSSCGKHSQTAVAPDPHLATNGTVEVTA